jgi:hypothetical protein
MTLMKTKLAIVSILVLLVTSIVSLGVCKIRLEKQRANPYAAGEAALIEQLTCPTSPQNLIFTVASATRP